MKTPREILLHRHQNAVPKLDRIRAALRQPPKPRQPPSFSKAFAKLWSELILPVRGTWGALAAVWMLLFLLHFGATPKRHDTTARVSNEQIAAAIEQHRLLAQLLEPPRAEPQAPPEPAKRVPQAIFTRSLRYRIS